MRNPFEFGRPVGEVELVDRQSELRAVKVALMQGQKLWLIGPRRYGKTSILVTAQEQLRADDAVVLRFNLEEFATPDALARAIVVGAARDAVRLDLALVEAAFGEILRRNDAVYTGSWANLTAIQKRTLSAVREFDGQNMTGIAATGRVGRPANSVKRALESLVGRDILRVHQSVGQLQYRLEDPFLGAWIERFTPPL